MRARVAFALVLLAVLFPVNAGAIQAAGASATAWWILGAALFAVPSTLVIVALGSKDGSPFVSLQQGGHLAHAGALGIWIAGCLATLAAAVAAITYGAAVFDSQPPAAVVGVLALALSAACTFAGSKRWWGAALMVGAAALVLVVLIALLAGIGHAQVAESAAAEGGWLHLSGGIAWIGLVVLGLVGAHEPFQKSSLRPVASKAIWLGMAAVLIGYLVLTLSAARALPIGVATAFTSLSDLGGVLGGPWGGVTSALVALAFAATTLGNGVVFRELQSDLRLPQGSTLTLIAATAVIVFIAIPLALGDRGTDASAGAYSLTQGATALLWSLGYVAMGGLAMRALHTKVIRIAGVLTIALGLVGAASVLTASFTPLISGTVWWIWVLALSIVTVGVAWVLKSERPHSNEVQA